MKNCFLIFCILVGNLLYAQQNYELLYIKGEYDTILDKSNKLEIPEDYYWSSIILDKQGKTLEAIELLDKSIIEFDSISILETLLSDFLYKTGQYSKAKSFLAKYIDSPNSFLQYINVLEFQGEYEMAIPLLERALVKDSSNLDYLTHLGDNYVKIDSIELAIKMFSKLLGINPNDQLIALKLANLFIKNKDYSKAVEICDIARLSDSTNKRIIKSKGIASFNKNDFQTAEKCFNQLYEQGDSSKFVLKHLGITMFNNESFMDSRVILLQAFQLDTNDYEICYMLGKCYLNTPEPSKGLYYFNRMISLLEPDPKLISDIFSEKQSIYSAMGNYEKAVECYKTAYSYNPKPEYLFYIASTYQHRLSDKREAIAQYKRFLNLLPVKSPDIEETAVEYDRFVVSLKAVAEKNIIILEEELFFEGKSQ